MWRRPDVYKRQLPYFEVIVTADDTTKHKPDPEPLNIALEKLGAAPENSVMVGDTMFDICLLYTSDFSATGSIMRSTAWFLFVFMDRRLSLFFRMFSDACWFPGVIKAAGSTDSAL